MNRDVMEGRWKQLRGRVKETWGKLTDDDLDKIEGRMDRLAGVLQEKYGYALATAQEEIRRLLHDDPVSSDTRRANSTAGGVPALLVGILFAGMACGLGCASVDSGITAKVKSKLIVDDTVKASQITVSTRDKVVTLTGSVDRPAEKDQAILLARDTKGVRDVVDMISVRSAAGNGDAPEPSRTIGEVVVDADITMAVKGRLLDDPQVQGLRIDVDTRDGVVYLTGAVRSAAEKDRAASLARDTRYVRSVVTNITIEKS